MATRNKLKQNPTNLTPFNQRALGPRRYLAAHFALIAAHLNTAFHSSDMNIAFNVIMVRESNSRI